MDTISPLLDGEEWRDIPGWGGRYSISNLGRTRTNYIDYVNQTGLCLRRIIYTIRIPRVHPKGYRYIGLSERGRRVLIGVHKLIALAFIPNPEGKVNINHLNGDKLDNRIENLEWCTLAENLQHAWRTGLIKPLQGMNHGSSLINDDIVRAIRATVVDYKDNEIKYRVAAQYGIHITTVNDIVKRRSWKHVL